MTVNIPDKEESRLGTAPVNASSEARDKDNPLWRILLKHILIILACSYFLFFFRMGSHDLWSPDEPRYAQVAREMLRSGDWIVPHLNGEIYTEKPPLYFWTVAALSIPFGDVNETTARFPSAVAALLTILATYFFGSRVLGRREALLGALVMATSAQFIWIGRIGVIDMLLALCILAALWLFYSGYGKRSFLLYLLGFLCLAPAALAKGPVGVAVPVVVMLAFLVVEIILHKDGARRRELLRFLACTLAGLALVALIVAPWWRAAFERSGGVYGSVSILLKQTRGRMVESYSHRQPIYYYATNILWQLFPWTVFLPATVCALKKDGHVREHRGLRFLVVWFSAIFIFFTLISGKRSQYILPAFPALGLTIGWALSQMNPFEGRLKDRKIFFLPLSLLLILLVAGLLAFPVISYLYLPDFFKTALPAVILFSILLFFISRRAPARPPRYALTCVMIATVVLAVAVFGYVAPAVDKYKSARPFCNTVQEAVGGNDPLFFYRVYRPNINYYMGRSMKRLESNEEILQTLDKAPQVFLILEQKRLQSLELGDSVTVKQVARSQIGSRDMVCVLARRASANE